MKTRLLLVILALTAFSLPLSAVSAWPYPVTVTQPDGTTVSIRIFGDENWSYKTNLSGRPVYQDANGFWHETDSIPVRPYKMKQLYPEGGSLAMFLSTKSPVQVRTLVIPVQFSDRTFTVPNIRTSIYNLFNQQNYSENGATGSVLDYFRDNLGGSGNLVFDVCDVVTLSGTMRYYGGNANGVTDLNLKRMVAQACSQAHSAGVDFSQYDFDKDGIVDNVIIITAGHNEAEGGGDDCIWPQSWNISDMGVVLDGKKVSNFSVCSELSGASGYRFTGIGTICHEFCHFLGLQDLYDVNGDTEGNGAGLCGSLSVMDRGNYNNEGRTPPCLTIFERYMVGLVNTVAVRTETQLSLPPVQYTTKAWVLPASVSGENYWLEYRGSSRWDAYIGGSGLVVYHIDKSGNAAGSMTAKMRWSNNAVNACSSHQCASFVSSGGGEPSSVSDAFYPGVKNVTAIHSSKNFPLLEWSGKGIGLGIADITRSAEGISCSIVLDNGWMLPVVTDWSIVPGQTSAVLSWETDKKADGEWNIIWGGNKIVSTQDVIVGSRTSYTFENLVPGEEYYCELFYTLRNLEGRHYRMEFRSVNRLSEYPLIGGFVQPCSIGVPVNLLVLNLLEDEATVSWYIDGTHVKEPRYVFSNAGSFKVEAVISHKDGSKETLTKILEVK